MNPDQKLIWRLIISHLNLEDLYKMVLVCKNFFFLIKNDEKFWKLFVEKNLKIHKLPQEISSWKMLFFSNLFNWDEECLNDYYFHNKKEKILEHASEESKWRSAFLDHPFLEGILYPFKLLAIPSLSFLYLFFSLFNYEFYN